LGTSTRRDQHTTNHARPLTVRPRRRLNAESRGFVAIEAQG
jgi:hypothetical protein